MNVALLSDTHVPSRAAALPDWVRVEVERADHVVHAGDFDSVAAYEELRELAPELTAVRGNGDPDLGLPEVVSVTLGGIEFVVTHGGGSPVGHETRVARTVQHHAHGGPTVGVTGHTHERYDRQVDGIRLLNPGSATGAWPASSQTMLVAEVTEGGLEIRGRRERG